MRFRVTMKDPDTLTDAIDEAVKDIQIDGLSDEETEDVRNRRAEEARVVCYQWFRYGEYLEVQVDTVAQTCEVVRQTCEVVRQKG